ncbi:MAG: hypothetical protein WBB19_20520 [Desulforhopalus sp.]
MIQRARSIRLMVIVFFFSITLQESFLLARSPVPEDVLTTMEISKLFDNKTAEALFVKTGEKGLFYFNTDGTFKRRVHNWLEAGRWRVNASDRLCISIAGKDWKCRIITQTHDGLVRQYIPKQNGNHKLELTFESFIDGSELFNNVQISSPPLEKLNKETCVMLFANKTVESETVRKGRVSLTYYSPDGSLEISRNGKIYEGTWRVTDNDRMCLKIENSQEKCRIIVREGETISKYIVKKNGHHQKSVKYRRFMAGKQF